MTIPTFEARVSRGEASEPARYGGMASGARAQCSVDIVGRLACAVGLQVLVQDDRPNLALVHFDHSDPTRGAISLLNPARGRF